MYKMDLKSEFDISNQEKSVKNYINCDMLIFKCFPCNEIGQFTQNCKPETKICPKCNTANCASNYPEASWKFLQLERELECCL